MIDFWATLSADIALKFVIVAAAIFIAWEIYEMWKDRAK